MSAWLPLTVLGAYLVGAVPFGLLLGRAAGIDVRRGGSGNIGATNVARLAGKGLGVVTLLLDALKGLVPTLVMVGVAGELAPPDAQVNWIAGTGFAAIVGHCWSPYLGFRGGKGVATTAGVLVVIAPWAALGGFAVYAGIYAATRLSSLGSLAAVVTAPTVVAFTQGAPVVWYVIAIGVVIVLKHRSNIARLWSRTETRV